VPANRVDAGGRGWECRHQCCFEAKSSGSVKFLTGAGERNTGKGEKEKVKTVKHAVDK